MQTFSESNSKPFSPSSTFGKTKCLNYRPATWHNFKWNFNGIYVLRANDGEGRTLVIGLKTE